MSNTMNVIQKNISGSNGVTVLVGCMEPLVPSDVLEQLKNEDNLNNYYNHINVFRNIMFSQSIDIKLDSIYVPLFLKKYEHPRNVTTFIKHLNSPEQSNIIKKPDLTSPEKLLKVDSNFDIYKIFKEANTNILAVRGTAGQGKSCILKYLALQMITEKKCIPIFIALANLSHYSLIDLVIKSLVFFNIPNLNEQNLKDLFSINSYKFILIADGFDEFDQSFSKQKMAEIVSFSNKYKVKVVASSRPGTELFNTPSVHILEVCDLNKNDVFGFITKYVEISECNEILESLRNNFKQYPYFSECIKTPLLCCLLVDVYRSFKLHSTTQKGFYKDLYEVLLKRHDAAKGEDVVRQLLKKYKTIDFDVIREIFCTIALFTFLKNHSSSDEFGNNNSHFTEIELKNNILKILPLIRNISFSENENEKTFANDYIHSLISDTHLIVKDGVDNEEQDLYTFCHKSIWEFYAASALLINYNDSELKKQAKEKLLAFYTSFNIYYYNFFSFFTMLSSTDALTDFVIPFLESLGITESDEEVSISNLNKIIYMKTIGSVKVNITKRGYDKSKDGKSLLVGANRTQKRKNSKGIQILMAESIQTIDKDFGILNIFFKEQTININRDNFDKFLKDYHSAYDRFNKANYDKLDDYFDNYLNTNNTKSIKNVSFNDIVISYEQGSKGKISEIIMTNYISILSKKLYDIYMELIKNIKVKNILAETKYF